MNAETSRRPAVSVGMPVYNAERWVDAAIRSILDQSFSDLELIISDNASTDATFSICERHAQADSRVHLYRNPENVGANRNYVAVLNHARAPYFKWASSNDICAPRFIEQCVLALESCPDAVLACSRAALFEEDVASAAPYDRDVELMADAPGARYIQLFSTMGLNNAFNGVIRRSALSSTMPMGNFQRADIVLMAELALMGKFVLVPEFLFFRRISHEAATKLKSAREVDQHIEPHVRRPLKWQNWRFNVALLRTYLRRQSLTRDSLRTFWYVLSQLRWSRRWLLRDVQEALARTHW
jgi:glycosyltransferase involved in cell wall biosynthesis